MKRLKSLLQEVRNHNVRVTNWGSITSFNIIVTEKVELSLGIFFFFFLDYILLFSLISFLEIAIQQKSTSQKNFRIQLLNTS